MNNVIIFNHSLIISYCLVVWVGLVVMGSGWFCWFGLILIIISTKSTKYIMIIKIIKKQAPKNQY